MINRKDQILFFIYFFLSTVFTWLFVDSSRLYHSTTQMLLSTGIAGAKWGIQILFAFIFLGEKKWEFVKNIGFVCLIGSCMLVPYAVCAYIYMHIYIRAHFFVGSLLAAVLTMVVLYYNAVKKSGVKLQWWFFWLGCLAIAITLQLTMVFHVIYF